ncbi:uncharacterized protein LOC118438821 [Folsomia candida]|uniref:Uncharacterized protein n=1 Tax=Folsomia candida TaxID=158441 RepID=A0A226DCC9_FOLCA|nr:uncharacterized protein LOC118438821 [Folsomia candida]OXA42377.1 hypothetical protein Fcan01_22821 [Folsomia candida]
MDLVAQRVEKLSQQLNILQEYIELKFGTDFKEFKNSKEVLHPIKTEVVVTEEDHHSSPPANTTTGDEGATNLTSDIVTTNAGGIKQEVDSRDDGYPPISTAPVVQVKVEPPDFSQSYPHTATPGVHKNRKVANIRYGGRVTSHRGIPPTSLLPPFPTFTRPPGSRRRKRPAYYALPPCDYCPFGWRSPAHYKDAHRDMCDFSVGPDGSEVLRGYRCPRANCDREGRLIGSIYSMGKHMKGDCTRKRRKNSYVNPYYKVKMSVKNESERNFGSDTGQLLLPPTNISS